MFFQIFHAILVPSEFGACPSMGADALVWREKYQFLVMSGITDVILFGMDVVPV